MFKRFNKICWAVLRERGTYVENEMTKTLLVSQQGRHLKVFTELTDINIIHKLEGNIHIKLITNLWMTANKWVG